MLPKFIDPCLWLLTLRWPCCLVKYVTLHNHSSLQVWLKLKTSVQIYSSFCSITDGRRRRSLKWGFHGARERFAKDANVEKMAKSNSRILCGKRALNLRGSSQASQIARRRRFLFGGNFKKFWNFLRTFPALHVVFCSQFVLKSFVLCAGPTQNVRGVR